MTFACIAVFFIMTVIQLFILIFRIKQNKVYFYKFYDDKLVYRNKFLKSKEEELPYKDFKEIKYIQGFMQSKFNVGDIYITTRSKNVFNKNFIISSIPDVEKNYQKIVKIFNT